MKENKTSKHNPKKDVESDVPSFDLGVLSPHSPPKQGKSAHAIVDMKYSVSPRQIRAEARTKQKHDFDVGESLKPIKQADRKQKGIVIDDDFVEDVPISKPGKKAKVAPSSKTPKKKKNSKKASGVKTPQNVRKHSLVKNGHFFASHNVDYEVLRFQTLCDPSIPSQIKALLSPNGLKLFKKACFGYLLSFPNLCMQNQAIHLLMKYELKSSDVSYFSAELKGERLNFGLREFAVITGLRCHTEVTDFGYTPSYVSKLMNSYFPNKVKVEKTYLKQIVTTKSWVNDEDAVKLCILYLIEYFICPSERDHIGLVDYFRFYLVESSQYESFSWGVQSYRHLIEYVRHMLNPFVHSYLIRGFPLAMQVWLYECCSSVNIDIATNISNSISRILNWSATKGQIWLAAIEDKMIKPEWMKFTNINESPEELSVMSLPDKVEYTIEEVEHVSENPKVDAPPLEPKESIEKEEKESILRKIKKLKRSVEKVDGKLEKLREDVFKELGSLRDLIKESVKTILQVINNPNDQVDAKFAGSSTKNTDQPKDKNNQQFQFNNSETVQLYIHGVSEREDLHAQSPIHGVTVAAQIEQQYPEDDNVGEEAKFVNVGDLEESEGEKKEFTLDDFELPDNFSQLVKFSEPIQDETTPVYQGRTRQSGKHARSPFLPLYSSGGSTSVGPLIFHLKHPFTSVIGQNVDPELLDQFHKWLYNGTDTRSKRRKALYSIKDNQIKSWLDLGVEKVDKKEWFFSLAHPGQVINDSHINVIMYYLRKRGKYSPHNNTRFTTTNCVFKTKIDQIYEKFKNSPQKRSFLDCGVFVAAFAEYVSIGELSIPPEDLSDIDQHHRYYGALLWDYTRKKQELGAISDSEVTCKLARRKGAPALNEKTRVQRKKK
ncbi:uncharacterized protein [Nicotiana sylvestris]|uniref:uncharacterized protein n=1 Tax=Nicotiana sylvestris TaxID=4096 RepID=UPI00388CCC6F